MRWAMGGMGSTAGAFRRSAPPGTPICGNCAGSLRGGGCGAGIGTCLPRCCCRQAIMHEDETDKTTVVPGALNSRVKLAGN